MKYLVRSAAMVVLALIATDLPAAAAVRPAGRLVKVEGGVIQGAVSGDVLSYKGIPYAAPPVGNLRWRAPQPVRPWTGVRSATRYGHDPMQKPVATDAAPPGTRSSEDCLVLNVWRPAAFRTEERLPVLVWIYGGGFVNGGESAPVYDGTAIARQGVVFVSLSYRLGRFGFFAHPALIAANEGPVGNFGLMDQVAALRWVQRNIAALGGDPRQVTVMGESAGGVSVLALITSPQARGLFHRAIVMSGGGRTHLGGGRRLSGGTPAAPSADQIGVNFARSVGISGRGRGALARLRRLPAARVLGDLNMASMFASRTAPAGPPIYVGGPVVDGTTMTGSPEEVFRRGGAAKVPLLIGTTSQDVPVVLPPSREDAVSYFGSDAEKARSLYDPQGKLPPTALRMTIGVDMTLHEPARFAARQMTAAGQPAWLYRFSYVAESMRGKSQGALHASELPFLFNTLAARYGSDVTHKDREAARRFNRYFVNFAKYGDPNGIGLPAWPKCDPTRAELMNFTLDGGPVFQPDPWAARLDLVERAAEAKGKA